VSERSARLAARLWDGEGARLALARLALAPASALYAGVVLARNAAYRTGLVRTRRVGARTVSIGNLRIGGSGKTPLVLWIAEFLKSKGWSPGIVSRGYGAKIDTPRAATVADRAAEVGEIEAGVVGEDPCEPGPVSVIDGVAVATGQLVQLQAVGCVHVGNRRLARCASRR